MPDRKEKRRNMPLLIQNENMRTTQFTDLISQGGKHDAFYNESFNEKHGMLHLVGI